MINMKIINWYVIIYNVMSFLLHINNLIVLNALELLDITYIWKTV